MEMVSLMLSTSQQISQHGTLSLSRDDTVDENYQVGTYEQKSIKKLQNALTDDD